MTMKTTYKQTSTKELVSLLKTKNEQFFTYNSIFLIGQIDAIQIELVSRGFTWEQVENITW